MCAGLRWATAIAVLALALTVPAAAWPDFDPFTDQAQRTEAWVGGEATRRAHSLYFGTVWAPLGTIRADGWRLRAGGGWSAYSYRTGSQTVRGDASFSDVLVGYHAQLGSLTLKSYAGLAADVHLTDPHDPANALDGAAIGAKLLIETWFNLTPHLWTAVDLSWSQAHANTSARGRLGWRVVPSVSLGAEAGAYGNVESDGGRLGGFVRYEWADGEISASGGITGSLRAADAPFAALSLTTRF